MSSHHKKPILAFAVLAVVAAAIIGNQFRANAERSDFIAAGPIAAHSGRAHGAIPAPIGDRSREHPSASVLVRSATPSAAPEVDDTRALHAPVVVAQGGPRRPGTGAPSSPDKPSAPPALDAAKPPADKPGDDADSARSHPPGQLKKLFGGHSARAYAPGQVSKVLGGHHPWPR